MQNISDIGHTYKVFEHVLSVAVSSQNSSENVHACMASPLYVENEHDTSRYFYV